MRPRSNSPLLTESFSTRLILLIRRSSKRLRKPSAALTPQQRLLRLSAPLLTLLVLSGFGDSVLTVYLNSSLTSRMWIATMTTATTTMIAMMMTMTTITMARSMISLFPLSPSTLMEVYPSPSLRSGFRNSLVTARRTCSVTRASSPLPEYLRSMYSRACISCSKATLLLSGRRMRSVSPNLSSLAVTLTKRPFPPALRPVRHFPLVLR
mmetsp:Transcript_2448/g.5614  ORF Transcript_2448/g.5614 Transcript_2448/m.5614 type:complete len:209 (+) Transcript_2448:716-1342(+)